MYSRYLIKEICSLLSGRFWTCIFLCRTNHRLIRYTLDFSTMTLFVAIFPPYIHFPTVETFLSSHSSTARQNTLLSSARSQLGPAMPRKTEWLIHLPIIFVVKRKFSLKQLLSQNCTTDSLVNASSITTSSSQMLPTKHILIIYISYFLALRSYKVLTESWVALEPRGSCKIT